jgi:NAD(P)H dehydrogenase (quinone)
MDRACGYGSIYAKGRFRGRRALLSLTTGGPEEACRKGGLHGDIAAILRPIHRSILQFVGFEVLAPQIHFGLARVSDAQCEAWLADYARRLSALSGEQPIAVGEY